MVTSKKFHTSLVLLFISGVFSFIASFDFLTNINGIPHFVDFLIFGNLFAFIFLLIANIRLRKINKYFFYAFILAIINLVVLLASNIFSMFNNIPIFDALEEGVDVSYLALNIILYVYILIGIRDCYNHDENVGKQMSHAFIYAILIVTGLTLLLSILSAFDALFKNYFFTMAMNIFSYLTSVGTATILLICYARAMNISHKTLKEMKARGEDIDQNLDTYDAIAEAKKEAEKAKEVKEEAPKEKEEENNETK